MGVEGGVVSLTCAGRTRDLPSYQYHNRSDVPASCIDKGITSQIDRSDLVTTSINIYPKPFPEMNGL